MLSGDGDLSVGRGGDVGVVGGRGGEEIRAGAPEVRFEMLLPERAHAHRRRCELAPLLLLYALDRLLLRCQLLLDERMRRELAYRSRPLFQ